MRNTIVTAVHPATVAPRAQPRARPAPASAGLRRIGRLDVAAITAAEALAIIDHAVELRIELHVGFANAHCINVAAADDNYAAALTNFLCLPDGIGVDLGSRLLFGEPFPENLNGTDFVPLFLSQTRRPLRVALLGGETGIAERAAETFAGSYPHHRFLAIGGGFFAPGPETEAVLAQIRLVQADVLLVALGVPRQEIFIAEHVSPREAPVAIAVGALLDFAAGKVSRAPLAIRRLRFEWMWRLALEPRRLAQRYIAGNPAFLMRLARQWFSRSGKAR